MVTLFSLSVQADAYISLLWNPSVDPSVAGYKIYYGLASHVYTNSIDGGNVTNAVIAGLSKNTSYYLAATTYDAAGVEKHPFQRNPICSEFASDESS